LPSWWPGALSRSFGALCWDSLLWLDRVADSASAVGVLLCDTDHVVSYVTAADGAWGLARCRRFDGDAGQCSEAEPHLTRTGTQCKAAACSAAATARWPWIEILDARAGTPITSPRQLLEAVRQFCTRAPRPLLLFDSLAPLADR
jgi:hypothetical protein